MDVDRLQLVAAQPLLGIEQVGTDVQHAEVVQQAGRRRGADLRPRAASRAHQVSREQGHQDAVIEQRRPGLARQRQVQRDRLGQARLHERIQHFLADRARRAGAGEERPALDRRARRFAQDARVDARARVDALVEGQGEAMREETVVQALVDRHAAFEQLDAVAVVDRLRGPDRPLRAELDDRLDERSRRLVAGFGCDGRAAFAHRPEANTGAPPCAVAAPTQPRNLRHGARSRPRPAVRFLQCGDECRARAAPAPTDPRAAERARQPDRRRRGRRAAGIGGARAARQRGRCRRDGDRRAPDRRRHPRHRRRGRRPRHPGRRARRGAAPPRDQQDRLARRARRRRDDGLSRRGAGGDRLGRRRRRHQPRRRRRARDPARRAHRRARPGGARHRHDGRGARAVLQYAGATQVPEDRGDGARATASRPCAVMRWSGPICRSRSGTTARRSRAGRGRARRCAPTSCSAPRSRARAAPSPSTSAAWRSPAAPARPSRHGRAPTCSTSTSTAATCATS